MPIGAAPPRLIIVNAVRDEYRPLAFDQQKLTGVLAERMRAAREGYLEHINDKPLFASHADEPGMFLEAAANAYDYSHDSNLKAVMDRIARELIARQSPESGAWALRSDLLGLLAYYGVTGDETAFSASKKIGDLLTSAARTPGSGDSQRFGFLIEPLVYLYRYTGTFRYLEFSKSIAVSISESHQSDKASLEPKLSTLMGLVELYRVTGDSSYYKPPMDAWAGLRNKYFSVFSAASLLSGKEAAIPDPCITNAWIQLTLNLLRLTGQPQFAEELERIIYNNLFAAQDAKTGNIFSAVPLNGTKQLAPAANRCNAGEATGISLIPAAVWGRYGNGIAVSLYTAGRASFRLRRRGTVQLYAETTYPVTGEILLHVEPSHNLQFPLRLRVPQWSSSFVADVGGSHLIGRPGEFLTIAREWRRGDTVKILLNMTVQVIAGGVGPQGEIAIQRGPQTLALGRTLNPGLKDLAAAAPASLEPAQLKLALADARFPGSWAGDQTYTIGGEYDGKPQQLFLIPFADAINYQLFMRRPPVANSGATGRYPPIS